MKLNATFEVQMNNVAREKINALIQESVSTATDELARVTELRLAEVLRLGPSYRLWRSAPICGTERAIVYEFHVLGPNDEIPGAGIVFTHPAQTPPNSN